MSEAISQFFHMVLTLAGTIMIFGLVVCALYGIYREMTEVTEK